MPATVCVCVCVCVCCVCVCVILSFALHSVVDGQARNHGSARAIDVQVDRLVVVLRNGLAKVEAYLTIAGSKKKLRSTRGRVKKRIQEW